MINQISLHSVSSIDYYYYKLFFSDAQFWLLNLKKKFFKKKNFVCFIDVLRVFPPFIIISHINQKFIELVKKKEKKTTENKLELLKFFFEINFIAWQRQNFWSQLQIIMKMFATTQCIREKKLKKFSNN